MARSFFARGKHIGGGNPPANRIPNTDDGTVQAKGQFGKPSGKTVASPNSALNGYSKGTGGSKPNKGTGPLGVKGPYGKVRVR
jgi:hypothetical protein